MNKLIVVGMRFQPAYAKNRPTVNETVVLYKEPSNMVNPDAVAVFFENNRIGYIRDADLDLLKGSAFPLVYKIERICTNYLQLKFDKASTFSSYLGNPEGYLFADTANNADKFFCDSSNGPLTYAEYDKMVQEQDRIDAKYSSNPTKVKNPYPDVFPTERNTTEKKKMNFNTNSMRDSFFKEVTNVAMDMQTGKLGVVTSQGIITATDEGVSVNPITEMGFKIPAFAMRVPVADLTKGDIIIGNGDHVFFMEGSKVGYLTVNTNGVIQETGQVANMFFGKNTVMAVKNMFGDSQAGGMNPMLMMAMMGDRKAGSGFGFKEMMMMQMISGNKDMGDMNPMLMMMFMGDK